MLKHSKQVSTSVSLGTRVLIVGALVFCGMMVAGFRSVGTEQTALAEVAAATQTDNRSDSGRADPPEAAAGNDTLGASLLSSAGKVKHAIPEQNLQIPDDLKGCAEKLAKIHAALKKYEKEKGSVPDWLSDLVPDYLSGEALFCPDDSRHQSLHWPDPKLPCSYCWELSPSTLGGRPPLDKTMRHYKTLQRGLFGDVVPIVRCFHHGRVLSLAWSGQVYTSPEWFEGLFLPNYRHNMLLAGEKPKPAPETAPEYDAALEAFIRQIDQGYPFFELKGIRDDWETCKSRLLKEVKQCDSNDEFYGLLARAARCLRDPHMGFHDLKGSFPKSAATYYPGISFLPAVDEQVVVMSSLPEYAVLFTPGTIVTKIDGKDARQFLEQEAKNKWKAGGYFSSPQRARLYAYRIPLQGEKNESHQITILKDNKPLSIEIACKWEARGWPHTYAMPDGLTRHGSCLYGKLAGKYGYIWLRRIDASLVDAIDRALRSFEGIQGLIIDLRGNGGGGYSGEVFSRFAKQKGPSPGIPFYRGDMVALIDAGTFSAGETFARDLVSAANAHLMGSPTAGSSTAKYAWKLPHELGTVTLSRRSRWGFDGQPIEYHGIAPHEEVEVVPAELQKGMNSGIKRAQEYLDKKWEERKTQQGEPLLILPKASDVAPDKQTPLAQGPEKPVRLYTVDTRGILVQVEIREGTATSAVFKPLGKPFGDSDAEVEGLAIGAFNLASASKAREETTSSR